MRIDKLLAHSGFGTRKQVRQLIKDKLVKVNDQVIKSHGTKVDPEKDQITVSDVPVHYHEFVYFMLNKPQGVISATEDNLHETVIDLLEPNDIVQEPHPVGRLDIDTEGLLILTNDGQLTHHLTSPNRNVNKVYLAEIDGIVTDEDVKDFKEGVILDDGYEAKPAVLEILATDEEQALSQIKVTVTEGKFHQVKRMFQAVGKEVLSLKRLSMGDLVLDPTLEVGTYRELTKEEIELLKTK
ncbi:MAG TPA: pseudouridine synthase [Alloiococcus sp.]|nr:pseudouridine synthase [Alloiococcus sp.]